MYISPDINFADIAPEIQKFKLKMKSVPVQRQVVNTVESKNKKENNSKYLSHSTNTFEKETKAKTRDAFNQGAIGKVTAKDLMNQFTKKKTQKVKKRSKAGSTSLSFAPEMEAPKDLSETFKLKRGSESAKDKSGINSTNDFLDDLEVADFTKVNSTRYKYYGYFFRIKQTLEGHWGNSLRDKAKLLYYKNSRIPANEDFITQLAIIMDSQGVIEKVSIVSQSGISDLDDAATEAFNNAGPFPGPPKGLIKNNKVKIKWGFVVKN